MLMSLEKTPLCPPSKGKGMQVTHQEKWHYMCREMVNKDKQMFYIFNEYSFLEILNSGSRDNVEWAEQYLN